MGHMLLVRVSQCAEEWEPLGNGIRSVKLMAWRCQRTDGSASAAVGCRPCASSDNSEPLTEHGSPKVRTMHVSPLTASTPNVKATAIAPKATRETHLRKYRWGIDSQPAMVCLCALGNLCNGRARSYVSSAALYEWCARGGGEVQGLRMAQSLRLPSVGRIDVHSAHGIEPFQPGSQQFN